jgi:hypothetical protein
MAVTRSANWLSQMRVDVPHLRSLESAINGDFDILAGRALAGDKPLVVRGFALSGVAAGGPASLLQLVTADGILFNRLANESGTFLWVPADRAPELLNPTTNGTIDGGWTVSATNYVGIEFVRNADPTTTDIVQFRDADTQLETPRQVPLARTLDYRIQISTLPFSAQPSIVPVATVQLNSTGFIVGVADARPLMFRLGSGGDLPSRSSFFSAWTRKESFGTINNTLFQGGDKSISNLKDWQDAIMTRMWETGGGEFWYSATADRNVTLITYGSPLPSGEYFAWNSGTSTLSWQGLRLLFDNSTAYNADIVDGSVVLNPGEAMYVDVDRTQFYAPAWVTSTSYIIGDLAVNGGDTYEATQAGTSAAGPSGVGSAITDGSVIWKYVGPGTAGGLVPSKGALATLGTGSPPGSRWIIAWRRAGQIFVRGWRYPVGTLFTPATTTAQGLSKISRDYAGVDHVGLSALNDPVVLSDRGGTINVPINTQRGLTLLGSNSLALYAATGSTLGTLDFQTCALVGDVPGILTGIGIIGRGQNRAGVLGYTGVNSVGLPTAFNGNTTIGVGGWDRDGVGAGVAGISGSNAQANIELLAALGWGIGVYGAGDDTAPGLSGRGGYGVFGRGGANGGSGVYGFGSTAAGPSLGTFESHSLRGLGGQFRGGFVGANGVVGFAGDTSNPGFMGSDTYTNVGIIGIGGGTLGTQYAGIGVLAIGANVEGSFGLIVRSGFDGVTAHNTNGARFDSSGTGTAIIAQGSSSGTGISVYGGIVGITATSTFGEAVVGVSAGDNNGVRGQANSILHTVAGVYAKNIASGPALICDGVGGAGYATYVATNPAKTDQLVANSQYGLNVCKAWGTVAISTGTPTFMDGANISSTFSFSGNYLKVSFAGTATMSNALYSVTVTPTATTVGSSTTRYGVCGVQPTYFLVYALDNSGTEINLSSGTAQFSFQVFARQ